MWEAWATTGAIFYVCVENQTKTRTRAGGAVDRRTILAPSVLLLPCCLSLLLQAGRNILPVPCHRVVRDLSGSKLNVSSYLIPLWRGEETPKVGYVVLRWVFIYFFYCPDWAGSIGSSGVRSKHNVWASTGVVGIGFSDIRQQSAVRA